jgi:hypothetical protein
MSRKLVSLDRQFGLTHARNNLWAITSAIGAVLCFIVLLVICVVAIHPRSRTKLDRVSFRIVVYALIAKYVVLFHRSRICLIFRY